VNRSFLTTESGVRVNDPEYDVDLIRFRGIFPVRHLMSKPRADTRKWRPRRQFSNEFKGSVFCLVREEGKTVGAAARDLDLTETRLRERVKRA
jgi:hypothetical protein